MAKRYRVRNSKKGFEVHASGGPIDDPAGARELFYRLGLAAATWARMELMLDAFLMRVNKASESVKLYNPIHPISFKRKVQLAKTWLRHPKISPHGSLFRNAHRHPQGDGQLTQRTAALRRSAI
jgi:hypothetical protein